MQVEFQLQLQLELQLEQQKLQQRALTDAARIESQEDIAQLRANVALDKADKDRSAKKTRS